jgi:hypothetical protein
MSFDITLSADDSFSRSAEVDLVRQFIAQLPGVAPNGERSFALCEGDRLWMEIDLEDVTEDGDPNDAADDSRSFNCVRCHIPYSKLGDFPQRDYFPTVVTIAQYLGWRALDEQTGNPLAAPATQHNENPARRPWWKLW